MFQLFAIVLRSPASRNKAHVGCVCTGVLARCTFKLLSPILPLPSARQHPSYDDCLEVKREYYQNCSVLGCVTQYSQSATHLYEQFLQLKQTGFVTLGPLRHA